MTRPKTRTAQLDAATVSDVKKRFGTWKNAYATIAPAGMTMDVFTRVVAGRPSNPPEVVAVRAAFDAWKKANLK